MQEPRNFISNGGRNSTSDILMDGVSQTNQENNSGITTALYTPPVDAVQEFNVQQNTYSADIGFGGNTVINVVTKSGTNAFHGSAFEFLQNSALNANNWFNNQNGIKISPRRQESIRRYAGRPDQKGPHVFLHRLSGNDCSQHRYCSRWCAKRGRAPGRLWRTLQRCRGCVRCERNVLEGCRADLGSDEQRLQRGCGRRGTEPVHPV